MLNDSIKNFHRERNNKGANKAFIEVNDATYGKLTELRDNCSRLGKKTAFTSQCQKPLSSAFFWHSGTRGKVIPLN